MIRFKALAYDPASRQCYQYTGTSNTLVAEAQIPADRELMGRACRGARKGARMDCHTLTLPNPLSRYRSVRVGYYALRWDEYPPHPGRLSGEDSMRETRNRSELQSGMGPPNLPKVPRLYREKDTFGITTIILGVCCFWSIIAWAVTLLT